MTVKTRIYNITRTAQDKMHDGTETKALFIKHLSMTDWQIIQDLQEGMGGASVADVIRRSIRALAGRL